MVNGRKMKRSFIRKWWIFLMIVFILRVKVVIVILCVFGCSGVMNW